mmetsp:Transcript_75054/g.160819  ORF Transcript_75054/g.160819 Transcript_75054/m.160819 type:complete len:209 (-) Transcript_75054:177-803(-)
MRGKDAIVGLDDATRIFVGWVDDGLYNVLLCEMRSDLIQQIDADAGAGSTAEGVEKEEALEVLAIVHRFPNLLHDVLLDLKVAGKGAPDEEVIRAVLVVANDVVRMEESAVGSLVDLMLRRGVCVDEDRPRHELPMRGLREEGLEGVVLAIVELFIRNVRTCAIGVDLVLEAEELPTLAADLATGLSHVDGENLLHHRPTSARLGHSG